MWYGKYAMNNSALDSLEVKQEKLSVNYGLTWSIAEDADNILHESSQRGSIRW